MIDWAYWAIIVALLVFIGWLLLAPTSGHDPLVVLRQSVLVA